MTVRFQAKHTTNDESENRSVNRRHNEKANRGKPRLGKALFWLALAATDPGSD